MGLDLGTFSLVEALVKPAVSNLPTTGGRLLLFRPTGTDIQIVEDGVTRVDTTDLASTGELIMLYERDRKYVLSSFGITTMQKKDMCESPVPPLK